VRQQESRCWCCGQPARRAGDGLRTGIAVDGSKYGLAAVKFALAARGLFGAGARLSGCLHVVPDFVMR